MATSASQRLRASSRARGGAGRGKAWVRAADFWARRSRGSRPFVPLRRATRMPRATSPPGVGTGRDMPCCVAGMAHPRATATMMPLGGEKLHAGAYSVLQFHLQVVRPFCCAQSGRDSACATRQRMTPHCVAVASLPQRTSPEDRMLSVHRSGEQVTCMEDVPRREQPK